MKDGKRTRTRSGAWLLSGCAILTLLSGCCSDPKERTVVRLVEGERLPLPPGRPPDSLRAEVAAIRSRIAWTPPLSVESLERRATLSVSDLVRLAAAYDAERRYRLRLEARLATD